MRHLAVLLITLPLLACGKDSPVSPTSAAACSTSNTAQLAFENRSPDRLTYSVLLDNINTATLGPGQTSQFQTVAAGVQHRVVFRYTNTNLTACIAEPIPVRCSSQTIFCAL